MRERKEQHLSYFFHKILRGTCRVPTPASDVIPSCVSRFTGGTWRDPHES